MNRILTISLLIVAVGFGCSKTETETVDFGWEYYPLEHGNFLEYDVEVITYDDFFTPVLVDTQTYQLREVLDSTSGLKNGSFRVVRWLRDDDTSAWALDSVWTVIRENDRIRRTEQNVDFIKLVFPVRHKQSWDGHAQNTLPRQPYVISCADESRQLAGTIYPKVAVVLQNERINLIENEYTEEWYARDIGMIRRYHRELKTEITGEVQSGVIATWTMINSGKL